MFIQIILAQQDGRYPSAVWINMVKQETGLKQMPVVSGLDFQRALRMRL